MNPHHLPSIEVLFSYFSYKHDSGELLWKMDRKKAKKGQRAGHVDTGGYLVVGVNGGIYKAHRIVWAMVNGFWPDKQIDHINCIKMDNRIENLRLATPRENKRNSSVASNSSSGVKGVSWNSFNRKWKADMRIEGKRIHYGYFETIEEAAEILKANRKKHHGEFSRN